MNKIYFSDGSAVLFDPVRVKFFQENGFPLPVIGRSGVDTECSKVRNQILSHRHKNTRFRTPRSLRLVLGHSCNFRCKYCQQGHIPLEKITIEDINRFMLKIEQYLDVSQLEVVQFWGGEPLLYWSAIQHFIHKFRVVRPSVGFSIVTNGSLMTHGIADDILNADGFGVILSHDGQGQFLRGRDPMTEGTQSREALLRLATAGWSKDRKYSSQGRNFAVNPVITSAVGSLKRLVCYYDEMFGFEVPIAESIPVIPTNEASLPYVCFGDDLTKYTQMLFNDVQEIGLHRFDNYRLQYEILLEKLCSENFKVNPCKALCFTTDPYLLSLDMDGFILPCQTFTRDEVLMNGDAANCGNITDFKLTMPEVHGYSARGGKCQNCPVLSLCMGGCPYLVGKAHDVDCRVKYHHFMGLLLVYVSMLFGRKVLEIIPFANGEKHG